MRYFIYYPTKRLLKRVDVEDNARVENIIDLVKDEFDLRIDVIGEDKTSIVLNYNGEDLKSTWCLSDLCIPSGSIIRCLYRQKKKADLYIHCHFNHQLIEIFNRSITINTNIAQIRKIISNQIGIPLSTFFLEKHHQNQQQRLDDQMKLYQYNIKLNDHIHLQVWPGYEYLISSSIKGFTIKYSTDDLIRHYQLQIALHFAAFYGYMELASSVLQLGARSDCPVGEHPSRQWASEIIAEQMPEMLVCPIHIAIERKQMKMVDLFFRQSLLCTQVIHPINKSLPYRFALSLSIESKNNLDKQTLKYIYLYLYDKQFNLKISLNTNQQEFLSLPRYCKIIRWYERAQIRVWKKYGIYTDSSFLMKRSYQSRGLLGYQVWIDHLNNNPHSSIISQQNILQKDTTDSDTENTFRKTSHSPLLSYHGLFGSKMQTIDNKSSSSIPLIKQNYQQSTITTRSTFIKNNLPKLYSGLHLNIQQTTLKSYQRHTNTSIRQNAIQCLEEVSLFKRKSWIQQVQFSQQIIKQRTKRFIQQPTNKTKDHQ